MSLNKLKNELLKTYVAKQGYKEQIDSFFDACETETQSVFLALLIKKLDACFERNFDFEFDEYDYEYDYLNPNVVTNSKFNYPLGGSYRCNRIRYYYNMPINGKIIGEDEDLFNDGKTCFGYREFIVTPQYYIKKEDENTYHFIDIVITSQRNYKENNEIIVDKKIAIEFDILDSTLQNFLTTKDFRVIRYNDGAENKNKMEDVLNQIFEMLDLNKELQKR